MSGQGSITSVHFDAQDRLWISTAANNAQLIDLANSNRVQSVSPAPNLLTRIFNWFVDPFYKVAPKPGEFYKIVTHLTATPDEQEAEVDLNNLTDSKDPWQPLWTGLLFMCGMLFISCLIFQFRDF